MRTNKIIFCLVFVLLLLLAVIPSVLAEEGKVQGTVWLDKTPDGVMDDAGRLAKITVILQKKVAEGDAEEVARTVSEADGAYSIAIPEAGTYRLRIELPSRYYFTIHGQDSSALPAQGHASCTPWFDAADGEEKTLNIGATETSAIVTFMVFVDEDGNGTRANAEQWLSKVRVGLIYEYEGETYTIVDTIKPYDLPFALKHLSIGTYRAFFEVPEGYISAFRLKKQKLQ